MPIIMLTAKAQEAEKILGLDVGADDCVTKPFSPRELRARIRAMLRRTTADSAGRRFVLGAFTRNRGRVLAREKLLDEVWGSGAFVTERLVDNHVMALRKKIEEDPATPRYLISVRGVGYRFDG